MDIKKPDNYRLSFYFGNSNPLDPEEPVAHQLVSERVFDAECYNFSVRYRVNLRPMSREMIESFRNALRCEVTTEDKVFELGYVRTSAAIAENPLTGDNQLVPSTPLRAYPSLNLEDKNFEYGFEVGSGFDGEAKIVFRINDNVVMERTFAVRQYNPETLISKVFTTLVDQWAVYIQDDLRQRDIDQLWDETLLLKHRLFRTMKEVHALDPAERAELAKDLA